MKEKVPDDSGLFEQDVCIDEDGDENEDVMECGWTDDRLDLTLAVNRIEGC